MLLLEFLKEGITMMGKNTIHKLRINKTEKMTCMQKLRLDFFFIIILFLRESEPSYNFDIYSAGIFCRLQVAG